ncbi:MAG: hypothetical protein HFJ48_04845 [Clostridia bacterium]|nr:hypothetical protein [Clostridia bacterium]
MSSKELTTPINGLTKPTNKLSNDEIWEAYRNILSGKSLTKVAKANSIDRRILRKYIERVVIAQLSEEKKQEYYNTINKNFRGNSSGEGRKGRNKKVKELQSETYLLAKQKIGEYAVSDEIVNQIYELLRSKKSTIYAQGTYIIKLAEFLDYFTGKGLTPAQVIDMIIRRPQIFSADILNTIDPIIKILEKNNKEGAKVIYEAPGEISKGKERIWKENLKVGNQGTKDEDVKREHIENDDIEEDMKNKNGNIEKQNIENGSDNNGRIFTNDAEVPGDEK